MARPVTGSCKSGWRGPAGHSFSRSLRKVRYRKRISQLSEEKTSRYSSSVSTSRKTSPASSSGEIVFHIDPEHTLVLDAVSGLPVSSEDVELGSFEAYLGPVMTMSLPPQTTPEMVIVNIPADFRAPQYVIADGAPQQDNDGWMLKGADGAEYRITEKTQFSPYLTRNIVTMEDLKEGSACLIWQDADGAAERIVIFAR